MTAVSELFKDPMAAGQMEFSFDLCKLLQSDVCYPLEDIMRDPRLDSYGEAMSGVEYGAGDFSNTALPIRASTLQHQPSASQILRSAGYSDSMRPLREPAAVLSTSSAADEWAASLPRHRLSAETSDDSSPGENIYTPASSSSHQDAASPNIRDSIVDVDADIISDTGAASSTYTGISNQSRYLTASTGTASLAEVDHQDARMRNASGAAQINPTAASTLPFSSAIASTHWESHVHAGAAFMAGQYNGGQYDPNHVFYAGNPPYANLMTGDYTGDGSLQATDEYALEQPVFRTSSSWSYHPDSLPHYSTVSPEARHFTSQPQQLAYNSNIGETVDHAHRDTSSMRPPVTDLSITPVPSAISRGRLYAAQQPIQSLRKSAQSHASVPATLQRPKRKKDESYSPQSSSSHQSTVIVKKSKRTLAKAEPSSAEPRNPDISTPKQRKGGRTHQLSETARQRTADMRNSGACWKCAIQRDPCDDQDPCTRCRSRAQRAHIHAPVECNREKIPDFRSEFLPDNMTYMHEEKNIMETINLEVSEWSYGDPIEISFTTGYGPPLRWTVYEFLPNTRELLTQLQYLQDPATGLSRAYKKYSPPFGLLKLDATDKDHIDSYLDDLMTESYLKDLGWTCFHEENEVDPSAFQCRLLNAMCVLFMDTQDVKLKNLLGSIIRIMIITYIMGHTLTISEDELPSVLSNIKHSPRPGEIKCHTSPRLANRQLKFFFAALRLEVFNQILRWQQRTFQSSGPSGSKGTAWLTSFCAMLGLAMVLEEIQRTIQIQADAKIQKGEMPQMEAIHEACDACRSIDGRYDLLDRIFRWKYPQKKPELGSFGPGTPKFEDEAEQKFLTRLRRMLEENADHLASRRAVECRHENQCQFTSRLVAKFLLPFLTGVK